LRSTPGKDSAAAEGAAAEGAAAEGAAVEGAADGALGAAVLAGVGRALAAVVGADADAVAARAVDVVGSAEGVAAGGEIGSKVRGGVVPLWQAARKAATPIAGCVAQPRTLEAITSSAPAIVMRKASDSDRTGLRIATPDHLSITRPRRRETL